MQDDNSDDDDGSGAEGLRKRYAELEAWRVLGNRPREAARRPDPTRPERATREPDVTRHREPSRRDSFKQD